jgi:hypothetical protein
MSASLKKLTWKQWAILMILALGGTCHLVSQYQAGTLSGAGVAAWVIVFALALGLFAGFSRFRARTARPGGDNEVQKATSAPRPTTGGSGMTQNQDFKQPPVLFDKTQELVGQIAALLGGPLITYWNNPRGAVCGNDLVALYEILQKVGRQETIYLLIKSGGGHGQSSLRLVNLLRQNCDRLVALVPLECASAATMIALGANEIQMGAMGYLTAVDTSLTHDLSPLDRDNDRVSVSLNELSRVVRLWRAERSGLTGKPLCGLIPPRPSAGHRGGGSGGIALDHAL